MKEIIALLNKHCTKLPHLLQLEPTPSNIAETEVAQIQETVSKPEDYVVGRNREVETIVDRVIDASKQELNSILPVFGMGGLGKTTLAKSVFNHDRIKNHFGITIWIYVSQPFVINNILQAILQKVEVHSSDCSNNREALLEKLTENMGEKTYFLVLDDVWNENKMLWEKLKECLMSITHMSGNSILVTTRSSGIAKMMEENIGSHELRKLSDDQCWSIFRNFANAKDVPMTSNLEFVQKEFDKRIGGLPLIAKVLGAAVPFSGDHDQWVANIKSVLTTPIKEEEFVKFTLKLSVDRLPNASVKQCFAYCSNFSKGCEFDKKQVIRMWMAQGFTQPDERNNETMEDTGERYFNILLSFCLFQDVVKNERGIIEKVRMHDLIHDIACQVSNDKKLRIDHIISSNWKDWTKDDKILVSKLRTINFYDRHHVVVQDKIGDFTGLRVLTIENYIVEELPNSIFKLKHLRYLDISYCYSIKKLPESIVLLYNLQTLRFHLLSKGFLPKNVGQMISLRHLEFSSIDKQMSPYLSQLIQLETLPKFAVGFEKGCKITELGVLRNLKGLLKLQRLEHVESKEEAETAKLVEKENLEEVHFVWTKERKRKVENKNDLEVLEGLQPPKNVEYLRIKYFLGGCLPNQTFVENLVKIELRDCGNCEKLPRLGQLGNLEILDISWFERVKSIGNEFYGNSSNNQRSLFPRLKELYVDEMRRIGEWEEVGSNVKAFPRLERLYIGCCRDLVKIPDVFGYCDEYGEKHLEVVEIIEHLWLDRPSNLWSFVTTQGGALANLLSRRTRSFFYYRKERRQMKEKIKEKLRFALYVQSAATQFIVKVPTPTPTPKPKIRSFSPCFF